MKSKLTIFNKHKTEIKDRVIGSLVRHFIYQETGHFAINDRSLKLIASTKDKRGKFMDCLEDTMNKLERFFDTCKLDESLTDHQCELIIGVYRDYSKMKETE